LVRPSPPPTTYGVGALPGSTDTKPAVLVGRTLLPAGLDPLAASCEIREGGLDATPETLERLAPGVTAIVADPTVRVDASLLAAAGPRLRIVANFAVGYDNVDLDACRRRGVAVTNTPGVLTDATAELALALTMAAARRMNEAEADLRAGRWAGWGPGSYLGLELTGATFGVVGMGRIGRRYAELCRGFGGEIVYTSRTPNEAAERELGACRVELRELLGAADVVSLHLPATPATAGLIGREELAAMRSHAILVNTSRGALVDAAALAEALREGAIGAAGLDVYEHEPHVPAELLAAPRCVLLPHIGSATTHARDAMARLVAHNVLSALRGEEPPNRVA
jgi:glyoxylate reductase